MAIFKHHQNTPYARFQAELKSQVGPECGKKGYQVYKGYQGRQDTKDISKTKDIRDQGYRGYQGNQCYPRIEGYYGYKDT